MIDNRKDDLNNIEKKVQENLAKAEKVLEERNRESKYGEKISGTWKTIVSVISIVYVLYHIYTSRFGMPMAYKHRVIHLIFVLILLFILYPAFPVKRKLPISRPLYIDMLLVGTVLVTGIYMLFAIDRLAMNAGRATTTDYIIGGLIILLVLEACRRVIGYQLLGLAIALLLYAYFGKYIPGILSHQGYSIKRLIYQMCLTSEGIFGITLGVSAQYMVLFVFFASILSQTGMGKLFNDFAMGVAGRSPGGPAKVAVVSSGLLGMIEGGAAANVATTGALTIPLMKRTGYEPYYAGAVEAAASTGGQIMPPIMGTVAFIMAEFTGIPYIRICTAAAIPAILYFMSVYFAVDFRAKKKGLKGLSEEEIPDYKTTVKENIHMVIPMILLVYLLFIQYTVMYAAFYALITTIGLSYIRRSTRMGLKRLIDVMVKAAQDSLAMAAAMATAGIIIGVLAITGIGLIVSENIVALSGGHLFLILFYTMIICIILGMGLPTSACYIITASIGVSILREAGIDVLPTHMFILYFSVISTITPPVALSSYVAAGLAHADSNKVGWTALRLAIAGFIIPFFFVYSPAMLLISNSVWEIIIATITAVVGVYLLAASSEGYFFGNINWLIRLILLGSALLLMKPGFYTDIIGIGLIIVVIIISKISKRIVKISV